jgi:hypothetical protein
MRDCQAAVEGPSSGEDESDGGSVSTLASKDSTKRRGHDRKRSFFLSTSFIGDLSSREGVQQHTCGEICKLFACHLTIAIFHRH